MAGWADRSSRLRQLFRPGSGETLDRALVTLFRGPESYTGEDVVEFSTHGGHAIPRSVVAACVALGAREARAGEFTQRAYLNGKLDLTQAEAVADLVGARSAKGRTVALHQLERGLGARVAALREKVIGLSSLLIQHIDFPEEDDAPAPPGSDRRGGRWRGRRDRSPSPQRHRRERRCVRARWLFSQDRRIPVNQVCSTL